MPIKIDLKIFSFANRIYFQMNSRRKKQKTALVRLKMNARDDSLPFKKVEL